MYTLVFISAIVKQRIVSLSLLVGTTVLDNLFIYLTKNVKSAEVTKQHLAVVKEIVTSEKYANDGVYDDVAKNWLELLLLGAM